MQVNSPSSIETERFRAPDRVMAQNPDATVKLLVMDDKYVSVKQARQRFDVSRSTLWRWQKELRLPVSHVKGRAYFRVADIQNLIERYFGALPPGR